MEIKTEIIQRLVENIKADLYSKKKLFALVKNISDNGHKYPADEIAYLQGLVTETYLDYPLTKPGRFKPGARDKRLTNIKRKV